MEERELTPDQAMEVIKTLRGPDGLQALRNELRRTVEGKKRQIAEITGEIKAFDVLYRLLDGLELRWGLVDGQPTIKHPIEGDTDRAAEVDKIFIERQKSGLCVYKAPTSKGGNWCDRKLRYKAEKKTGYCRHHMKELGLSADGKK